MSCTKASKVLDAQSIQIKETIPASRKLGETEATDLARSASRVVVAKGKKLTDFKMREHELEEVVPLMLGATGNLRAPTIRVGKTILVGFNDTVFNDIFG